MPLNGNDFKIGGKYVTALHCLQETNFKYVDVQEWKKKGGKIYHSNTKSRECGTSYNNITWKRVKNNE